MLIKTVTMLPSINRSIVYKATEGRHVRIHFIKSFALNITFFFNKANLIKNRFFSKVATYERFDLAVAKNEMHYFR
jgi:hypothetical protein